jgi:plastocyanin
MMTLVCRARLVLLLLLPLAACGSNPAAPSEPAATITIGAAGVFPAEVRIKAWGQVRFVNNDSRLHTMVSDPVDVHSQCPPLNLVGVLQPGESRNTGTLNLPGTCGFHDHVNKTDANLPGTNRGRINHICRFVGRSMGAPGISGQPVASAIDDSSAPDRYSDRSMSLPCLTAELPAAAALQVHDARR